MKILRRKRSTYALSLILCLAGIAALLATLWKTWPEVSSAKDPFSTFLTLIWTEKLDLIAGLAFKLVYLVVLGDAMLISGIVLLVLSVQRFISQERSCGIDVPSARRIGNQAATRHWYTVLIAAN